MALGEEDLKQVAAKVGEILKDTFGSDDFKKTLGGVVRPIVVGVVQAETKAIGEKHEELAGKFAGLEKLAAESPTDGKGGKKGDESDEVKSLRAQVKAMEDRDAKREADRLKERAEAQRSARRAKFTESASKLEMRGIPQAWAFLEAMLEDGDDDAVVVKVKRDGFEEKVPLDQFLSDEFPKTEDGKIHYPAKNQGGSGGKQWDSGAGGSGGKKPDVGSLLEQVGWGGNVA